MIKIDLARQVSCKMDVTLAQAEAFVDIFLDTIGETLESGDKVLLAGFGVFEVRQYPERAGRNPKTGEALVIPPSTYPAFRAGKNLKERIAKRNREEQGGKNKKNGSTATRHKKNQKGKNADAGGTSGKSGINSPLRTK